MQMTLRAARVNVGLTRAEASKKIGVSEKTLFNWENGKSTPPARYNPVLEALYGAQIGDIIFCPKITV